ncbi:hypothetical protein, partial [Caulobacter rhizosphaerae]|uniref:hypothetical protein n=1 Tax=Caulobacter rhizosphaerae TaxID=2010972 RepID=UPI001E33EA0D
MAGQSLGRIASSIAPDLHALFLLPLREKVSAKPTDEGSMNAKAAPSLSTGRGFERLRNPLSVGEAVSCWCLPGRPPGVL